MEDDNPDESVLDDEEVRRLERELEHVRRKKAKQIRKMRRNEKEKRRSRGLPASSSSDSDGRVSDDEEDITTRASTRSLVNGLDKAQQRFRFNVERIELKYAERERRGLPESRIEMDQHGNFFFPETMSAGHQQAFINRMFQKDAQFGKGSVSAPLNSIDSFDGDLLALRKAQKLDENFGKQLKMSEDFGKEEQRKRRRSSDSSNYPMSSTSNIRSARYSTDLDDDVFHDQNPPRRQQPANEYRRPKMSDFFNGIAPDKKEEEEEEEETFCEDSDEENTDEDGEMSDEEESEDEEDGDVEEIPKNLKPKEETPEAPKLDLKNIVKTEMTRTTPEATKTPVVKKEMSTPIRPPPTQVKTEVSTTPKPSPVVLKKEEPPTSTEVITLDNAPIENQANLKKNKKITDFLKPVTRKPRTPRAEPTRRSMRAEVPAENNTSVKNNEAAVGPSRRTPRRSTVAPVAASNSALPVSEIAAPPKEVVVEVPSALQSSKKDEESAVQPLRRNPRRSTVAPAASSSSAPTKEVVETMSNKSSEGPSTSQAVSSGPEKTEKPIRKRKPTQKMTEAMNDKEKENCHSHGAKRKSNSKEPYCKHCEIQKEEKKQAKLEAKKKRESEPGPSKSTPVANKTKDVTVVEKVEKAKKNRKSAPEGSSGLKRRSATVTPDEPDMKKQKLTESDLISIPCSMAVVIDTDLITTENPQLGVDDNLPKFSEKESESTNIWNSSVDSQLLSEMKRTKKKGKSLFGVPLARVSEDMPMIKIWAENLDQGKDEKDQFESDFRRLCAQDKKARGDLKAGYNVRQ